MIQIGRLAIFAWLLAGAVHADTWPTRPVTMVVTFPAGGPTDGVARVLAHELGDRLGQRVVVENKGGAGGTIAAAGVAKSSPDGYTIMFAATGTLSYYRTLYKSLPYDPITDLTPIVMIGTIPQVIVASPKLAATSLRQFVEIARARPGKLNIGDSGIGTTVHILAAMFAREAGIEVTHVHYRGAANSITDVMSGQIDAAFSAYIPLFATMKVLGVTAAQRLQALPDVPTFRETGQADIVSGLSMGLAAAAGTPPEIVARINAAVNDFLTSTRGRDFSALLGMQIVGGTTADMRAFLELEMARLEPVIRAENISAE